MRSLCARYVFQPTEGVSKVLTPRQNFRKYSSEAPQQKKSLAPIYATVGAAGVGIGLWRYYGSAAEPKDRPKVFVGGDQGWVDLKLAAVEDLSPNTKRFRFEFEDKEAVSGLHVACKWVGVDGQTGLLTHIQLRC